MAALSIHEWGDGTPAFAIHGITGHGRRYEGLAVRLPGHRVIGVDLRGHGASSWEPPWGVEAHVSDLVDTADRLGIERAAWVGHSFGGLLICELAARYPDRVERAVLLDPALHVDPKVARERAELTRSDISFGSPDEAIEARLRDGSVFTTPRAILEREAELHLEQRSGDGRWRWRYSAPAVIAAWGEMARPAPALPDRPTLVVLGARSWIPVVMPDLPHVKVVTVPGGHSVLWDDFDETADAVAAFLE